MIISPEQLVAIQHLKGKSGIVWWKIGTGKTRIALNLYLHARRQQDQPFLVIGSPKAERQWRDEMNICQISQDSMQYLSYGYLSTSNYRDLTETWYTYHKCGMVVLDELWLYKSTRSLRSQAIQYLHELFKSEGVIWIGLSGSLITSRNIEDLYGQARAIGISSMVATSLTHFRTQFCIAYEDYGLHFCAKRGAVKIIQERLAPNIHIYFPQDTREVRLQRISVTATRQQAELFDTVSKEYYAQITPNGTIDIQNAGALLIKLQQISDGIIILKEGQTAPIASSKLTRLVELVQELSDAGQRPIIWFAFKASLDQASATFGDQAALLSSHHDFDSKGWRTGQYTCCLATIGSGASLNDFARSQYAIIYSTSFNAQSLAQAMGRTNRVSSPHQICHYYLLQTAGGVDAAIFDLVLGTQSYQEGVINISKDVLSKYLSLYVQKTTV